MTIVYPSRFTDYDSRHHEMRCLSQYVIVITVRDNASTTFEGWTVRIEKYLDAVIERHGLTSDSALARLLGVKQNTVSQWRAGTRTPDNEACLQIAQALEMPDPMPIIMAADMDRAERAGQRSLWEVFSRRMAQAAAPATLAVLVASVTNFVTPSAAQAAPALDRDSRTLSVMSNKVDFGDGCQQFGSHHRPSRRLLKP
ncbi:helix-turn-helix domain-containing protein [Cupriavidus taiwanensis]|uniref:helix-turn-helix domain-containing protein n=1 Tax=Cupriavidus taiwanensis TaxID=164546 RepID=UPI0039C4ABDC